MGLACTTGEFMPWVTKSERYRYCHRLVVFLRLWTDESQSRDRNAVCFRPATYLRCRSWCVVNSETTPSCVSRMSPHYAPNGSIYQYGKQQAGLFRTYKPCGQIRHFVQIDMWTNTHCLTTAFEWSNRTFCPNRCVDILGKMSIVQKHCQSSQIPKSYWSAQLVSHGS